MVIVTIDSLSGSDAFSSPISEYPQQHFGAYL